MKDIPLEIERKYIIKMPALDLLAATEGGTHSRITQTYLSSPSGITHRVRRREYDDRIDYTETKKVRIDRISVYEDERELSAEEYDALLASADPARTPIIKERYTIPAGGLTVEIDVYPQWTRTAIMEIELPSRETEPPIPPFLTVIREVTGVREYSNAAMSKAFPEEVE